VNQRIVPDSDHVSRYCKPTFCTEEYRPTGAAFELCPTESFLSVNWLEFLNLPSRENQITEVRRILRSKFSRIPASGRIAVLNVGDTRNHVSKNTPDQRTLITLHQPEVNDPSHSGIYGLEAEDFFIGELIAEVVIETYAVKES
jgi:hypothetical protein